MKVLNLYSGIGGNRKLWEGVDVTAVEYDEEIAKIYQDYFPNDKVVVTDAHQYLLEHYKEFDFIWSSPPCPTHSRFMNLYNNMAEFKKQYPKMELYQEIIFLKHFFKGRWVVENVISYYNPLIKPIKSNSHYFWANFKIPVFKKENRKIRGTKENLKHKLKRNGFDLEKIQIPNAKKTKLLNNCVLPELGLCIFQNAKNIYKQNNIIQTGLFK